VLLLLLHHYANSASRAEQSREDEELYESAKWNRQRVPRPLAASIQALKHHHRVQSSNTVPVCSCCVKEKRGRSTEKKQIA
jgi:hypothetical protein